MLASENVMVNAAEEQLVHAHEKQRTLSNELVTARQELNDERKRLMDNICSLEQQIETTRAERVNP